MRVLACLAAAALSCRGDPAPAPSPTSAPTSTSTSTPTPTPSAPAPIPIARAVAAEPAGPTPLSVAAETVIDPASSFEVELSGRLADARLVLLDSADAHVPARSAREVAATTQLTLSPAAPLVPGSRYVLRVEGASTREVRDGDRSFAPHAFALLAAGTPPPPEPKRKPKSKSRNRR